MRAKEAKDQAIAELKIKYPVEQNETQDEYGERIVSV